MSSLNSVSINRHQWFTLAILSSTLLVVFFSETMLLPAIPEIMRDFGISYGTAAWIFSSYLIVAAVMTPIAGKMSDLYGKRKVLLALLTLYVAGITAGVFSNNISFLLASRIIQGIGLAAVPAAFSLLRDTFPPEKLAIAVGVFGSAYSAGSVVGLLAGATIIQMFGWHSTFLSIIPFAAAVTIIIARFVKENNRQSITDSIITNQERYDKPEQEPHQRHHLSTTLDINGALVLSITIISFLIALTLLQSGINSSTLPEVGIAFLVSAISLSVFVFIERRVTSPLVDMRLLKDKTLMPSYIIATVTGITMFMAYPAIVQLVRNPIPLGFGGSAVDAANVQLPFMIMFLLFSSIAPIIINRIGKLNPIIIGALISLSGSIGLMVFHSTEPIVSTNIAIIAAGLSLTIASTWNIIVSSSPRSFVGISVGVGALLLFIGMSIGPALTGVYMENHETIKGVQGSYPSLGSYDLVYITSAFLSSITLGFALILRRRAVRKTIEI
ncbi:MAG: MFS transporter [Candidatus Nitrosocosmicus sp.]